MEAMAKHKPNPGRRWDGLSQPMTADELLDALTAALAPVQCSPLRRHRRLASPVRRGCGTPRLQNYLGETCAL